MSELIKKARAKAAVTMKTWVGFGSTPESLESTGSIGELLCELADALEQAHDEILALQGDRR